MSSESYESNESGDDQSHLGDELPEDLMPSAYVGPYVFPNNNRRRIPGVVYIAAGLFCLALWLFVAEDAVLINGGFIFGGLLLVLIGLYHLIAGWNLDVDEGDALVAAIMAVGFPVGHASAQLGWRGPLSRPTWRILVYSNEPQPEHRGLVFVDGVNGIVIEHFTEANPEDWSVYHQ